MAGVTSRKARGWRKASEAKRRESRWLQKLATLKDTDPVAAVLEEQVHLAEKAEQLRKAEALAAKTAETRRANKRVGKLGARRLAGARPSGPRELALPKRTAEVAVRFEPPKECSRDDSKAIEKYRKARPERVAWAQAHPEAAAEFRAERRRYGRERGLDVLGVGQGMAAGGMHASGPHGLQAWHTGQAVKAAHQSAGATEITSGSGFAY